MHFTLHFLIVFFLQEFYKFLPERGVSPEEIIREAELYDGMSEFKFYDGRVSGAVYSARNETHRKLLEKVSLRRLEFYGIRKPKFDEKNLYAL